MCTPHTRYQKTAQRWSAVFVIRRDCKTSNKYLTLTLTAFPRDRISCMPCRHSSHRSFDSSWRSRPSLHYYLLIDGNENDVWFSRFRRVERVESILHFAIDVTQKNDRIASNSCSSLGSVFRRPSRPEGRVLSARVGITSYRPSKSIPLYLPRHRRAREVSYVALLGGNYFILMGVFQWRVAPNRTNRVCSTGFLLDQCGGWRNPCCVVS